MKNTVVLVIFSLVALVAAIDQQPIQPEPQIQQQETTDAAIMSEMSEGQQLMTSLANLIQSKKDRDQQLHSKLSEAAAHSAQLQSELEKRQQMLDRHSSMLQRLEMCLSQGPPEVRQNYKEKELGDRESLLKQREEELQRKLDEINNRGSLIEQTQTTFSQQEAVLKDREEAIRAKETDLEQVVASRVAAQTAQIQEEAQTELRRQIESITAANLQAYHANDNNNNNYEGYHAIPQTTVPSEFVELSSSTRAYQLAPTTTTTAANPTTPTTPTTTTPTTPAPTTQTVTATATATSSSSSSSSSDGIALTTTPPPSGTFVPPSQARQFPYGNPPSSRSCIDYANCGDCTKDSNCAWCGGKLPRCLLLDVNSKFLGSGGDGLTNGQCPLENWQSKVTARVSIFSLNVFGADDRNVTARGPLILKTIRMVDADVIALQEVEDWLLDLINEDRVLAAVYQQSDFGSGQAPGGLYILSKFPIKNVAYYESIKPGQVTVNQRGRALVATIDTGNGEIVVANTALDWRDAQNRADTLDYLFSVLANYNNVFFVGDFNFDDNSQPESGHIPKNYVDIWKAVRGNDPGFTWDPTTNDYAYFSDKLSRPSRIDRMLLRSSVWLPRDISLVGCSSADLLCGSQKAIQTFNAARLSTNTKTTVNVNIATGSTTITSQLPSTPSAPNPYSTSTRPPSFVATADSSASSSKNSVLKQVWRNSNTKLLATDNYPVEFNVVALQLDERLTATPTTAAPATPATSTASTTATTTTTAAKPATTTTPTPTATTTTAAKPATTTTPTPAATTTTAAAKPATTATPTPAATATPAPAAPASTSTGTNRPATAVTSLPVNAPLPTSQAIGNAAPNPALTQQPFIVHPDGERVRASQIAQLLDPPPSNQDVNGAIPFSDVMFNITKAAEPLASSQLIGNDEEEAGPPEFNPALPVNMNYPSNHYGLLLQVTKFQPYC